MICRTFVVGVLSLVLVALTGLAAPVIDSIPNTTVLAGKSLIIPITATSSSGLPLTYTITSSTNAFAVVMHTNNPFWQLTMAQAATNTAPGAYLTPYRGGLVTVTNVGTMTFELFPEYAPHTIKVFQGLTTSGFYNSNTIFHRVISGFMIQGGDPETNGSGGLVFQYDDEFNPQAIFSGNGQLALANSGKDTDGSQFFVTITPQRTLDFQYTIFGQLLRGFAVLTNLNSTAVNTNDDSTGNPLNRPYADEIIQTAAYVTNITDTAITITATNVSGVTGKITVIAADGAGGFATNTFTATTVADTNSNDNPFIYPSTVTNLVAPVNGILTNTIVATELDGLTNYWYPLYGSTAAENEGLLSGYYTNSILRTLTYNVTNGSSSVVFYVSTTTNYVGPIQLYFFTSASALWDEYYQDGLTLPPYDEQIYNFIFGDTPIIGQTNTLTAQAGVPFNNLVLATFTNSLPFSPATNFTAVINWGDDTTNTVAAMDSLGGPKAVLGSHTYPYPGSYPVYVSVQSSIGASTTILSYVNVTTATSPVTNLFTVNVNGSGTVSPAYSSTPLVVGNSYSVSASPSSGWLFSSWTDENGIVLGTGTNLTFTLTPGLSLSANFLLAVAPTLTITYPANGAFFTNLYSALATMTGTISNNATVTNVYFQLNGGGWQPATGITNWTARFTPASGISNVLQAYAINNFGLTSAVSTILVKYLAGDILTVSTNGLGSITPSLNGSLLPLGSNYVLTATPAGGFTFADWSGSVYTNNPTLSFTMATNLSLVANFEDVSAPKLTITSPTSGQQVKSNQFNVQGATSSANWQVANVLYSLNNTTWTNANSTNGWTNWFALVTLAPGTNTLSAYAVDPTGKPSLTNTVSFQYLFTNQLQIRSIGKGTISPNDSNAWLNVGQNYAITATAASGFAFTNWTIGTNFTGGIVTNSPTVQFAMASNLTLQVTFADITKPTLNITNVTAGQHVTNGAFTLGGTASDNVQVSTVLVQLNGGAWTNAYSGNLFTNWTAALNLNPGTNTVSAYSVDSSGNNSATNTVSFQFVVTNQLLIQSFGKGTLSPNDSNAWLNVGQNYAITATAAAGFAFTNWTIGTNFTGGIITNNATVQFAMASNLTLQVTFADVTAPTLAITNLTAGQRITNTVFTLGGSASDNVQVSNVLYQLNNGAWTPANSASLLWTNWNAVLNLQAGTNTVSAFAVDNSGNHSTTNSFTFDSVITNQLQIRSLGLGTINPNYSNSWLEVGRNYAITATPAASFVATNWTISTNFAGGIVTNNATVQFMMATNLTLQIKFAETTKPTVTFTWPTAGLHLTNALPNVVGTASDNWGVASVAFQLNSSAWYAPTTTNVWTNWNTIVQMNAGTNTLSAYAVNLGGNFSLTNSISVVSSNAFKLQLSTAGAGAWATNGFNFSLEVSTNLYGHIQYSTNLAATSNWSNLTNFAGTNATLNFLDTAATNNTPRFYRAVIP